MDMNSLKYNMDSLGMDADNISNLLSYDLVGVGYVPFYSQSFRFQKTPSSRVSRLLCHSLKWLSHTLWK